MDKYEWLEDIYGEKSTKWVKNQKNNTLKDLKENENYPHFYEEVLNILQADDKIPTPIIDKNYIYNFWTDKTYKRGIIRRIKKADYINSKKNWELVLDIDDLCIKESISWTFKGIDILYGENRALVFLSDGGKDAHIVRELDLDTNSFIDNGMNLPESKGHVKWIDKDNVLISRNFGKNSLTKSGYPGTAREWKRGEKLSDSKEIFKISEDNLFIFTDYHENYDVKFQIFYNYEDIFNIEILLRVNNKTIKLDICKKMTIFTTFAGNIILLLNQDWKSFKSGSLISINLHQVDEKGSVTANTIQESTGIYSVSSARASKDSLVVNMQNNICSELFEFKLIEEEWIKKEIKIPKDGSIYINSINKKDNEYYVSFENFLTPASLYLVSSSNNKDFQAKKIQLIKQATLKFKNDDLITEQVFTMSKDGTMIPYFITRSKDIKLDGKNPTIIMGYGGFAISMGPSFSNSYGKMWLEKGGVYVVANIRGGGEFGPDWHQAAIKHNRHKAYEDFFAVSEDLIDKKITSPKHLGCMGGSNGGLLMGVCFTQRPDLYNAILCSVPLLDMLKFHKLLAGYSWIAEYGTPENDDDRKYLQSYSPYHNVKKDQNYPKIFIRTSTQDDRVHPGHARKMAAILEEYNHPYYYNEDFEGGHGSDVDNFQVARRTALLFTYFQKMLF